MSVDGNQWIAPVLKSMRRSSPTGLKITLRSVGTLASSIIRGQFCCCIGFIFGSCLNMCLHLPLIATLVILLLDMALLVQNTVYFGIFLWSAV